ncbi:hypothetical protein RD792_007564 [Penstemon davidsonii]|uniref:Peptidase A1 domain-containing protein n=1 Tax=Penstemon davidsonii TaxID=160366 RepID=A0ABR0D6S6_9LAMI|nr:hypothetical protein RD792_007564 [Penstemon davidsonii]
MVKCRLQRWVFLLVFFFTVFINFSNGHEISLGTKLELIHRHGRNLHNEVQPTSQLERLTQLLQSDTVRINAISQKLSLNHRRRTSTNRRNVQEGTSIYNLACTNGTRIHNLNVSGEMSMNSGADFGTGQYFVHFEVGSPVQKLLLIADTGSDLTWMNCKYRCRGGDKCKRSLNKGGTFQADISSSFRTLPCSSRMCRVKLADLFSLARCPSAKDPCAYDYRYNDGSSALGLFAKEKVTFTLTDGRKARLHNVLVGCSESTNGPSLQIADGIMGLGYSNYSFALRAAKKFGGKFSYCLVDHLSSNNVSSYLIFGSHNDTSLKLNKIRYTELVLGVLPTFYALNIRGISIGGTMLDIPHEVWDVNGLGGTILDSGTSLTSLVPPAYEPVMAALKKSLSNFSNLNLDIGQLQYCFNSTGFDESLVPRLIFHFEDGARFRPAVKSYVIDVDVGVKCLGFVLANWPGPSVIGNIMQQNYFWEFDIKNSRLGFGSSTCI